MRQKKVAKSKVWEMVCSADIISRSEILDVIKKYKSIGRYSLVLHDKDVINLDDLKPKDKEKIIMAEITREYKEEPDFWVTSEGDKVRFINDKYKKIFLDKIAKKGNKIDVNHHYHTVLEFPDNYVSADLLSRWFGIPSNFFEIKKTGKGRTIQDTLIDCTQYLTHETIEEQAKGKYLYPDSEIVANWPWRELLERRKDERNRYGSDLSDGERLRLAVMFDGLSLADARAKDPRNYEKYLPILKRNRGDYLGSLKPPQGRMNYYVYGRGGTGKDLLARGLARSLYPGKSDEEIFYEVGASGVEFDSYDGQPVIIWIDVRAGEMLKQWGRGNVLNMLDPYPKTKKDQNVKYSNLALVNHVNILTGPDHYEDFLGGLMGGYVDRAKVEHKAENTEQIYRRIPVIIPIRESDFDILVNKGIMEGTREFHQYYLHERIRANFRYMHEQLSEYGGGAKLLEVEKKAITPIIEVSEEINLPPPEDEVDLSEFESYGEPLEIHPYELDYYGGTLEDLNFVKGQLLNDLKDITLIDKYDELKKRLKIVEKMIIEKSL